jgi:hypothetical protein
LALIWVRAPLAGALGVLALAVVVVWVATSVHLVTLRRPGPIVYGKVEAEVAEGGICIRRWQEQPTLSVRRWSFDSEWLGLGIRYVGIGGCLDVEFGYFEARAPLWLIVLLFAGYPAVKAVRYWQWRRRRPVVWCKRCRYDLTGNVSGVCPECGTAIAGERRP